MWFRRNISLCKWRNNSGASLVVQWLRIHLAMQGTWVPSLVGGTKIPHALEKLSPGTTTTERRRSRESPRAAAEDPEWRSRAPMQPKKSKYILKKKRSSTDSKMQSQTPGRGTSFSLLIRQSIYPSLAKTHSLSFLILKRDDICDHITVLVFSRANGFQCVFHKWSVLKSDMLVKIQMSGARLIYWIFLEVRPRISILSKLPGQFLSTVKFENLYLIQGS